MAATIEATNVPAREAAERLSDNEDWVFLGSGPNHATALFSAAQAGGKLRRQCLGAGHRGVGAHPVLQQPGTHADLSDRAAGPQPRPGLGIAPLRQGGRTAAPSWLRMVILRPFPLPWMFSCRYRHPVPELFAPLVYCLAGELLAYHLAEARQSRFFQPTGGVSGAGDRLRESHVLRRLDELLSD